MIAKSRQTTASALECQFHLADAHAGPYLQEVMRRLAAYRGELKGKGRFCKT